LLYFPCYHDAFFPSVAFNLLAPFLKNWPLKKIFRGHFGPQVKFSGWNTVNGGQSNILVSKIIQLQSFMASFFPGWDTPSYENLGWVEREVSDVNFQLWPITRVKSRHPSWPVVRKCKGTQALATSSWSYLTIYWVVLMYKLL